MELKIEINKNHPSFFDLPIEICEPILQLLSAKDLLTLYTLSKDFLLKMASINCLIPSEEGIQRSNFEQARTNLIKINKKINSLPARFERAVGKWLDNHKNLGTCFLVLGAIVTLIFISILIAADNDDDNPMLISESTLLIMILGAVLSTFSAAALLEYSPVIVNKIHRSSNLIKTSYGNFFKMTPTIPPLSTDVIDLEKGNASDVKKTR